MRRKTGGWKNGAVVPVAALWFLVAHADAAHGEELDIAKWRASGENAADFAKAADRDYGTCWTSSGPQSQGLGLTLDMGGPALIHRLLVRPGPQRLNYARSLRLAVGDDPATLGTILEIDNTTEKATLDLNIRFNPVKGRLLRLEIGPEGAGLPWSIAELHVYGFPDAADMQVKDAVVLPDGMPDFVRYAARDVAYFLGEITGRPVDVVSPEQKAEYGGTLFVVETPRPVDYPQGDMLHRQDEAIKVYAKGREIRFAGATHKALMYSMFEFLDRQGVRWLYPAADGECVLRRGEIDLSVLPLDCAPQFVLRKFGGCRMYHTPTHSESSRWFAHNRFNKCWNKEYEDVVMGGGAYREVAHHTFGQLVPATLYEEHPEFFPMFTNETWKAVLENQGYQLGQRVPSGSVGRRTTFCTSSPEVREHLVEEMVKRFRENPEEHAVRVGQDDATAWCECPRCTAQDQGAARYRHHAYGEITAKSNRFFDLVVFLARELEERLPDRTIQVASLAYSQTLRPPTNFEKLPSNVSVVAVIGSYAHVHLPPESAKNTEIVDVLKHWRQKTDHLAVYTHEFLKTHSKVPLAGITSLAEWTRFWKDLGVEAHNPEVRGEHEYWRCNPWYNYALGRLNWNPDEPAQRIINEFFTGYFREAAAPMKAYYLAIENRVRGEDLSYGLGTSTSDSGDIFTPDFAREIEVHLRQAEEQAVDYRIVQRVAGIREGFDKTVKDLGLEL